MDASIVSLGRALLRAVGIAARRGRVGTRECGPVPRFLLISPPPYHCNLTNLRPSRMPLFAFSYEIAADFLFTVCDGNLGAVYDSVSKEKGRRRV